MRTILAVVATAVLSASLAIGITHHVDQQEQEREVTRVSVNSFNNGFIDGACNGGQDGYGNPCK